MQELLNRLRELESVVSDMKVQAQDKDSTSRQTDSDVRSQNNSESYLRTEDATSNDTDTLSSYHDLSHKLSRSFGSLHICESGTLYTSNGFWAALQGEVIFLCVYNRTYLASIPNYPIDS